MAYKKSPNKYLGKGELKGKFVKVQEKYYFPPHERSTQKQIDHQTNANIFS